LQHIISLGALYLYPSYRSYKALDSKNFTDAQEWLCYWILIGILTIPLLISNSILNWFPFYYELKLLFSLWLIFPKTKGHLTLFYNYVVPYMDKFNVKVDIYSRDISVKSKKYAELAWQKGIEIAQVKFAEVLTKGPSALLDFKSISLIIGNNQANNNNNNNNNGVSIREITDDEESFNNDDYSENNHGQKKEGDEIKSNQIILKKKRSTPSNSNIKKFSIESKQSNLVNDESKDIKKKKSANKMSNEITNNKRSKDIKKKISVNKISNEVDGNKKNKDIRKKRNVSKANNEFDEINNETNYQSPNFKKNDMNRRTFSNSPYSQPYSMDYNINNDKELKKNKKNNENENDENNTKFGKGNNNILFMNMMSNQRPGPGGMMGISDVYSSESDDLPSNNSNSNDEGNYYENEEIEENYNYNKNNLTFGEDSPRKNINKVNQRSMKDNYYYDIGLTQDDDTVIDNDMENETNNYSNHQRRKVRSNIIDNREQPDINYQQSYFTNFNSFLH
jgi:receptor expression-enhancing protein 1/2/3/4